MAVSASYQEGEYMNITADTLVKSGRGRLYGFVVNSHSSGTIKVWDSTAASGTVLFNTITLAADERSIFFPVGINFKTGLYVDIGGTIDVTVIYT